MQQKRGQIWDTLIPWIIGIGVLILMLMIYFIISGKGTGAVQYLRDLLRFGR